MKYNVELQKPQHILHNFFIFPRLLRAHPAPSRGRKENTQNNCNFSSLDDSAVYKLRNNSNSFRLLIYILHFVFIN